MAIPGGIIDCEHVLAAMSRIDKEGVPLVNQSRGVEVQHRDKSYPPKYVLSLAFEVATGSALPLSNSLRQRPNISSELGIFRNTDYRTDRNDRFAGPGRDR